MSFTFSFFQVDPPRLVQLAVVGHVPLSFESAAIFKHQRNGGTVDWFSRENLQETHGFLPSNIGFSG